MRNLNHSFSRFNIYIKGIAERENRGNGKEKFIKEMIKATFPEVRHKPWLEIVRAHLMPTRIDQTKDIQRKIKYCNLKKLENFRIIENVQNFCAFHVFICSSIINEWHTLVIKWWIKEEKVLSIEYYALF